MRRNILTIVLLFPCLFACRSRSDVNQETGKADAVQGTRQQESGSQPVVPPVQPKKNPVFKKKPPDFLPAASIDDTADNEPLEKVDWGKETTAGEVIAMAKNGEITEIQWHVMPNILRAVASDGRIFYIRNENKGIDLRGMLMNAGVIVGKGGVTFQHVF